MADLYWDNVAVALHFDGANGSTTFTDEKGHTVTPTGTVAIKTDAAAPLTGNTASAYFDGGATNPRLVIAHDAGFASFGTGDFSIEGWLKQDAYDANTRFLLGCEGNDNFAWAVQNASGYLRFLAGAGLEIYLTASMRLSASGWHHWSVCRASGVTRLFVDGAIGASHTGNITIGTADGNLHIGNPFSIGGNLLIGHLDDVEITKGVARRTAAFTRPSAPFEHGPIPGVPVTLPIAVTVATKATGSVPLAVSVLPATLLSGAESVCIGTSGRAAVWGVLVTLAGVDVTDQVVGEITVDAEEGAARIAEFTLRPPIGTALSLATWTGRAVTIDVVDRSTGVSRYPVRRFTGVVDTPALDLAARQITLRCTDDLQGRCDAVSNAVLHALIGGYESGAVFDAAATGWSYAQDQLSTVPKALDITPSGELRATAWAAKATPDITIGSGLYGDASIAVELAERASLINEVTVEFGYRFPRVKAAGYHVAYTLVDMAGFAQFLLDGKWFLQRDQVVSALEKAGGTVESVSYTALPTEVIPVGDGFFTPSAADAELCLGFTALVSFDFTQTVEEQHRIRVYNQRSIDAVGVRPASYSGALEGEYPDLVATESAIKLYKADVTATPPANVATVLEGAVNEADVTLTPETDRAAAEAAMCALIAKAKTQIHASHRGSRVRATLPHIPALDLDKTARLVGDGVQAQGKIVRVFDRLDPESGLATSEIAIAVCGIAGVGIVHASDPTTAPAGTTAASSAITDAVQVTYNAGASEDHVITVTFPAVTDAERANDVVDLLSSIAAPIDEDLFVITLQD